MAHDAKVWIVFALAAGLAVYGGCDFSTPTTGGPSMDEITSQLDAQDAVHEQEQADADKAQEATPAVQPPAATERTLAGRQGVGEGGYYTAIVGARRHVLNRVERLPWLQGVQHFKAEHGRLPKDHAEFMSRIIEPLQIDLGYKEENQEFLYDPSEGDWGEVYVVEKLPAK